MAEIKDVGTHDLYDQCKMGLGLADHHKATPEEYIKGSYCAGYTTGFFMGVASGQIFTTEHGASAEALMRSFVNYVNAHPGRMDDALAGIVLVDAWLADGILLFKQPK